MDEPLRARFEAKYGLWKERLLDLSGRNRLLNFRSTKVTTINITLPDPGGLFQRLVMAEKALKFPLYQGKIALSLTEDESSTNPDLYKVRPGDIETTKSPPDLEKSLYRLAQLARTSREERGVNTLYVALGMLEWHPIKDAGAQLAPLLLAPVGLEREDHLHPYVLSPFDEDAEINPTLIYMLRNDFSFALPEFPAEPDEDSLTKFFDKVEKAVSSQGWRVLRDAHLAQFQFKKLAMYKDLEEHEGVADDNHLVTGIAGCGQFDDAVEVEKEDTFDQVKPNEVFTVLDADKSQMAAILRARAGQDLIIQGPPGTGKSQTITNLIAQSLAEGKKVLFVSEKMAALSVVYRRLAEAGVAPFCLELHSDKANKRDTLSRINGAAQLGRRITQPNAQLNLQFDTLMSLRRELNEYVIALHCPMLFGKSAFQIHGELARLDSVPDVAASINIAVSEVDHEHEIALLRQARRLSQVPEMLLNYYAHPWYGCLIEKWTMEGQTELGARLGEFRDAVANVAEEAARLSELMDVKAPLCLDSLIGFRTLVEAFSASPTPPRSWLSKDKSLDDLRDAASALAARQARHHQLRDELSQHYTRAIFVQECEALREALNPTKTLGALSDQTSGRDALARCAPGLENDLHRAAETISRLTNLSASLAIDFDDPVPQTVADCTRLIEIARLAGTDPRPTEAWLDWGALVSIGENARDALERQLRLRELRDKLLKQFNESLFKQPVESWRTDFTERFSGFLRFLNGEYRQCMKTIRATMRNPRPLRFAEAKEWIGWAAEVKDTERWFEENHSGHVRTLGYHFRGEDTDWEKVGEQVATMQSIFDAYAGKPPNDGLRHLLIAGGSALNSVRQRGLEGLDLVPGVTSSLAALAETLDVPFLQGAPELEDAQLEKLERRLEEIGEEIRDFQGALRALDVTLRPGASRTSDEMASDIEPACEVREAEREITGQRETLLADYEHFFSGVETDWTHVISALEWCVKFMHMESVGFGEACLDAACSPERVAGVKAGVANFLALLEAINRGRASVVTSIDVSTIKIGNSPLDTGTFNDLIPWLELRIQNVGTLAEWIQFQGLRRDCRETGLDEFVEKVLEMKLPAEALEHALKKRLLILQLDNIYDQLPVLRTFQWRDRDDLVKRFKKLDKDLMKEWAQVVRARIASRQPSLLGPAVGQFGFLRRELTKQRRHAPLRKLFQQCGSVILDITPCLMMSPLSVATYLPKDSALFDVVVFDEASQVPAEEAIGAILRGAQLVVAGDSKQLPPTRFFERSLDDGGDEYDEESNEASLESVLDDCAASGMYSNPLEWHYRSKHESLIAFSNAEFYDNNLITFPPPEDPPPPGIGVRFDHVHNGVYDRGRSRTNRVEARRVAALIAEHFDSGRAARSLGVIALSTAQEDAIREEVERLIQERPDLEQYLKPSGEEPFFVKPLENVQGDERDTIIISVGYGRAPDGTMSLNFGPINQEGGERRLNVLVSRARQELVLVSSIQPGDIDESKVTKSGPKLLKRYLQFAKDGRLPPESAAPKEETESGFEQAVWEALSAKGLEVDRQVGCSRFRIDLAIRDPKHPGRYLLGIECDGATYHSSAVARDRDRLRQQVLEDLGWKIHRIWSTDWIRDPKGCLKRVLYRIEEQEEEGPPPIDDDDADDGDQPDDADITEPWRSDDGADAMPGFELAAAADPYAEFVGEYSETPPSRRAREDFYDGDDSDVFEDVIKVVNHEGPIHEELVVQRVARMYNLKRTGAQIDQLVRSQISRATHLSGGLIRKSGHFLWPPGLDRTAVVPRRPGPSASLRTAEQVAPEEIEGAALIVARLAGGVTQDELIPEIARVLGYQRTGSNIEAAAGKVVTALKKAGRLEARGEFLFEVEEPSLPPRPAVGKSGRREPAAATPVHSAWPSAVGKSGRREPARATPVLTAWPSDIPNAVREFVEQHGLKVVDRLKDKGAFWVVASQADGQPLSKHGFRFAKNGGRATNNVPAWYVIPRANEGSGGTGIPE